MTIEILSTIHDIKEEQWNKLIHENDPFNNYHFFKALEESQSIGTDTGFEIKYFVKKKNQEIVAIMTNFLKSHSYGEYIFDWSWAEFYQRHGYNYYPKLVSQNPFTPVTNKTFIYENKDDIEELISFYAKHVKESHYSSAHILFHKEYEKDLIPKDFRLRHSFQYHFENQEYETFDDFLSTLKNKKKKQILKERKTELKIKEIDKDELENYASTFYNLYIETIIKKRSHAYLNLDFFKYIFTYMKDEILLFCAFDDSEKCVAASLFFKGKTKLYGRYWGAFEEYKNLHFELCYYQGIDYCIRNGIKTFEAGAQGEHKIQRGFIPKLTYSSHYIRNLQFQAPIYNFIEEEKRQIAELLPELAKKLPFKVSLKE